MDQESFVFGSLTVLMLLGVVVLLSGVAQLGDLFVWAGTAVAMASVVGMGVYLARLDEPDGVGH